MIETRSNLGLSLSAGLKTVGGLLLSLTFSAGMAQTASAPATETTPAAAPLAVIAAPSSTAHNSTLPAQPAPQSQSQSWQQLTALQKQALAPLGAQWSALSGQQQKKWLALSQNFTQLSVSEQITLHARMSDWVSLSPRQRNLARLNFNKLQSLPKEDKKAKWEAYQALSAEEKRLLSAAAISPTKSAAPTAKPLPAYRLVESSVGVPAETRARQPEINRKTLLPRPPAVAKPSPVESAPSTDASRQATETAPS